MNRRGYPRGLLDPAVSGWGRPGQAVHPSACSEQPRGLLVLIAAQCQVRDPDEYLCDQGACPASSLSQPPRCPRLGLVVCYVSSSCCYRAMFALRFSQHGRRYSYFCMPPRRCRPTGRVPPSKGQLSQRIRPGDPLRAPLRLGDGSRAGVLVTEQPVQLSLSRPHPDDILGITDLGEDRDRLLVVLARAGELAARAIRSASSVRRTKSPTVRRAPGTRRAPSPGTLPHPARPGRA